LHYFEFMVQRTEFLSTLLSQDINFFLVESDAVWLSNPLPLLRDYNQQHGYDPTTVDLISAQARLGQDKLQGGFQLNYATPTSKQVMKKLVHEMQTRLQQLYQLQKDKPDTTYTPLASEQFLKQKFLAQQDGYRLRFWPSRMVASGQWYGIPNAQGLQKPLISKYPHPAVILNNFVIGTPAKIQRAQRFHHWYLQKDTTGNDQRQCFVPAKKNSNTTRAI